MDLDQLIASSFSWVKVKIYLNFKKSFETQWIKTSVKQNIIIFSN